MEMKPLELPVIKGMVLNSQQNQQLAKVEVQGLSCPQEEVPQPVDQEELMQRLLEQLQIKDTPLQRKLLREFVQQEIPLRASSFQMAEIILRKLGDDTPENIEKAVLGIKLGIPPEPVLLNSVHAFLKDSHNFPQGTYAKIQAFINQLAKALARVQAELPDQTAGHVGGDRPPLTLPAREIHEPLQKIQEYLRSIALTPQQGRAKITEQLRVLLNSQLIGLVDKDVQKLGNKMENPLTVPDKLPTDELGQPWDRESTKQGIKPPLIPSDTEHRIAPELKQLLGEIKFSPRDADALNLVKLFSRLMKSINQAQGLLLTSEIGQDTRTAENIQQGIKLAHLPSDTEQSAPVTQELKQLLGEGKFSSRDVDTLNLVQLLSRLIKSINKAQEFSELPQIKKLAQEGTAIKTELLGQQVWQTLNKAEGPQEFLYFNLPFIKQDEQQSWGQLRIIKDNASRKDIDPKHFTMALLLNTRRMGPLFLEFKVRNKEIIAGGKVTEEWVANLLQQSWPKLQDSLAHRGYHLHSCAWQVGPLTTNLAPRGLKKENSDGNLQMVDVKI